MVASGTCGSFIVAMMMVLCLAAPSSQAQAEDRLQVTANQDSRICPSPFRLRGNECLFIPEYLNETLNWDESRQKCLSMGGDLAQPQNMVDFVNFLEESYPGFKPSTVWLGATDREVEQEWKWLSGESVPPAMWEPWIGNQPSGDGNCMEIHKWPYTEFFMNDWYCHNKGYFACEIGAKSKCKMQLECDIAGGSCVTDADACTGRLVPGGCKGKSCQCCIPGCPEEKGFFRMPHPSNQCFKFFDKPGTWFDADTMCREAGLVLARPLEMINLRSYLVLRYGSFKLAWLDGRGNGTCIQWNRGPYGCISEDVPLWFPEQPGRVTDTACLMLLSAVDFWKVTPGQTLWAELCSRERYPLCELVLQ